jgi:hypothetical protein
MYIAAQPTQGQNGQCVDTKVFSQFIIHAKAKPQVPACGAFA